MLAQPTRPGFAHCPASAARWLGVAPALLVLAGLAVADTVVLEGGGKLYGDVVADPSIERGRVAIDTVYGRLELERKRVASIGRDSPAEAEYRRRTPSVADNVPSQFAHAMWCRDQGLGDESRRHLRRVIRLDPSHAEARQFLGFQNVNGDWVTREEVLAARGLVRWEGEYRTSQEIALLKRQQAAESRQQEWKDRLSEWRKALNDRATARQAEEQFEALTDPAATAPLIELFRGERDPIARRMLADTLGRVATPAAMGALADAALADTDPEVRALAIERLASDPRPGMATPFLAALRSKNNALVNRAGAALGVFGAAAAVEPLIDALVTTHERKVGDDSGGQRYDINTASGVLNVGGGPRTVRREVRNPAVLTALVETTGVNFSYDEARWRAWLASQQVERQADLRRDP